MGKGTTTSITVNLERMVIDTAAQTESSVTPFARRMSCLQC